MQVTKLVLLAAAYASTQVAAQLACLCANDGLYNFALSESCCTGAAGHLISGSDSCQVGNDATPFAQCCVDAGWGASC
ncbi:hypothetical protein C8R47DRAFT_1136248 [Mycena vitilis]|nr:hypothetical protein C8R47DRAFT_1136248 [Mycena vitilis]